VLLATRPARERERERERERARAKERERARESERASERERDYYEQNSMTGESGMEEERARFVCALREIESQRACLYVV
jgi:hypothetical protein